MKRIKCQKVYFALITFILGVLLIAGCSSSDEAALLTDQHDSVRPGECTEAGPKVALSNPVHNSENVATDTVITVTFDEAMDPTRIVVTDPGDPESLAFTLRDNDHPLVNVEGTVAMNDTKTIATFTPTADLHGDSWYTVTITTYARNAGGTPLGCGYQWEFKTDVTP
jgi:hypothetical protein